jgi:2,4'-dihydroxyacetophenone dioxygenase
MVAMTTLQPQIETSHVGSDKLPWVPFAPFSDQVHLKYYKIDPVRGEIVASMRIEPGAQLPTHYHTGIVIIHTIRGAWRYIEHDWTSSAGDTVYETAGSSHTPETVGDEVAETFLILVGELEFLDENGTLVARENWKTAMARYHDYCDAQGIEPVDLTSFAD